MSSRKANTMRERRSEVDEKYRNLYEQVAKLELEEKWLETLGGMLRRRFVSALLSRVNGSLLDAGCSSGQICKDYTSGKILGVDISPTAIERARKTIPEGEFYVADVQDLGFLPTNLVDNILCSEVLEHLPNPARVLREFHRVLVEGGTLIITTPNYIGRFIGRKRRKYIRNPVLVNYGCEEEYWHTSFTPQELKEMLSAEGFQILDAGTFNKEEIYCMLPAWIVEFVARTFFRKTTLPPSSNLYYRVQKSIWRVLRFLRLDVILNRLVPEGCSNYIIARKGLPEE
jgi:SAM-dependent methyltransferase